MLPSFGIFRELEVKQGFEQLPANASVSPMLDLGSRHEPIALTPAFAEQDVDNSTQCHQSCLSLTRMLTQPVSGPAPEIFLKQSRSPCSSPTCSTTAPAAAVASSTKKRITRPQYKKTCYVSRAYTKPRLHLFCLQLGSLADQNSALLCASNDFPASVSAHRRHRSQDEEQCAKLSREGCGPMLED